MPKPRISIPLASWPAPDRLAWDTAHRPGDQLDPPGRARSWKPNTRDTNERAYGHWLKWHARCGTLEAASSPADRCTPGALRAYIREVRLSGVAPFTLCSRIHGLNCVLHAICPDADFTEIDELESWLRRSAKPVRNKAAKLVSPAELVAKARTAMANLEEGQPRLQAKRYRDLLIVAFLAQRPIRLANLAAITLQDHMYRQDAEWWFRFTEAETKTSSPLRISLPKALAECFEHYLAVVRPILLEGPPCDHLWATMRRGAASEAAIYGSVCATTAQLVGLRINPHLFRDIVATFISEEAPEDRAMVADILGHTQLATSQIHYDHAGSLRAQQRLVKILDRIVGDLPALEI